MMNWATKQGFGPLCSHGISMGGHMAALAATSWSKPICVVPCLASTSASVTFCQVDSTGGRVGVQGVDLKYRKLNFSVNTINLEGHTKGLKKVMRISVLFCQPISPGSDFWLNHLRSVSNQS